MQQQIVYRELPESRSVPSSHGVTDLCTTMGKWASDNGARIVLITPVTGTRVGAARGYGTDVAHVQTVGLIFVVEKP